MYAHTGDQDVMCVVRQLNWGFDSFDMGTDNVEATD